MFIETQKLRLFFIYFILSALAMYFVFSSAIHIPFYHHDIYKYSWGGIHNSCKNDPGFNYLIRLGRPFSAYLDCYNYKFGSSLGSIAYLRMLSLLFAAFAMSIFAILLHFSKSFFWPAFFISGAIFLLPAIQVTIIMAAMTLVFSILTAFLAYYCMSKSHLFIKQTREFNLVKDILYFIAGMVSLLISLLTYPSLSACFLLPAFVLVLFDPLSGWQVNNRILCRNIIVFVFSCFLYFMMAKNLQVNASAMPANYQFKLSFHFLERIIFLYKHFPFLWSTNSSLFQAILLNLIIIVGLLAGFKNFLQSDFFKDKKNQPWQVIMQVLLSIIILLLLGSSIFLIMPSQDVPIGRVIFVFQAMSILILWWSLIQISSLFRGLSNNEFGIGAGILFFWGAVVVNYNITKSVLNDNIELNFITATLAKHIISSDIKLKRIHFIAPAVINFNGLSSGDDILNINSTHYVDDTINIANTALLQLVKKGTFELYECIFPNSAQPSLDEAHCIREAPKDRLIVTYSQPKQAGNQTTRETVVIDMNLLNWIRG